MDSHDRIATCSSLRIPQPDGRIVYTRQRADADVTRLSAVPMASAQTLTEIAAEAQRVVAHVLGAGASV